jgi:hypothetical protein
VKLKSVLPSLLTVLDDHVHFDVGICHGAQNLVGDAGRVGHAEHGNFGFVTVKCNAGNDGLFHVFVFLKSDQCAGCGFFNNVDIPGCEAESTRSGTCICRQTRPSGFAVPCCP